MNLNLKAYAIEDDGNISEVPFSESIMTSKNVLLFLDEETESIWIWKGSDAPVRKKFISARRASELREQVGTSYKVKSIDEGDEPEDFLSSF